MAAERRSSLPADSARAKLLNWWQRPRPRVAEHPSSLLLDGRPCPTAPFGEYQGTEPPTWVGPPPEPGQDLITFGSPARPPAPPMLDTAAIRRTIRSLDAGAAKVAGDFYGYLFSACPRLRQMFPPEMGAQNDRLFAALVKIVSLLDTPDRLARYLTQLGADHRKYGVKPEHYAPVGTALIQALRRHVRGWDDQAEAAWLAAYGIASEAMIAGAEACEGPAWWRGHVTGHQMRTSDLAVLDIQLDQPLPFEPGQYVTVMTGKWPRVWRSFSVACAPGPGLDRIQLHVRQVPGGWVSTALIRDTGPPDELIIGPPVGSMTPEAANGHDMLLVAGGVGLAPMMALAEDILARDESAMAGGWGGRRRIALFHGARDSLGLYEMPRLRELERSYPWLQVEPVVSDDPGFHGRRGMVSDAVLADDWPGRDAFLAGPPEMIEKVAAGLAEAGMAEDRVHFDSPEAR